jgi:hypothetical protein
MATSLVCGVLEKLLQRCIRKRAAPEGDGFSFEFLPPSVASPRQLRAAEPVRAAAGPWPSPAGGARSFESACTGGTCDVSADAWTCVVACLQVEEKPPPTPSTSSGSSSSTDYKGCESEAGGAAVQPPLEAAESEGKEDVFEGDGE